MMSLEARRPLFPVAAASGIFFCPLGDGLKYVKKFKKFVLLPKIC